MTDGSQSTHLGRPALALRGAGLAAIQVPILLALGAGAPGAAVASPAHESVSATSKLPKSLESLPKTFQKTVNPGGFDTASSALTSSVSCPLSPGKQENATPMRSGLLCLGGALGQWFPRREARLLLGQLTAGKAALELQPVLESRLALAAKVQEALRRQIDTEQKIARQWGHVVKQQSERLQSRGTWYKSPVLWFATGVLCALALGYGSAVLYEKTR